MHADDAAPESSALRSTAPNEPDWVRHAIAWHVFPLGAVGAPALCPEGDPDDPSSPAGAMAAEHRLRRLLPEYRTAPVPFYAVYTQRKLLSAKVRSFIDFMVEKAASEQADL